MARIRTIKPDMFSSESVINWGQALEVIHNTGGVIHNNRDVRWTFIGLLTYCDDYGRGRDDARLIKSAVWPLDDDITSAVVEEHLAAMAADGDDATLCRYEVDDRRYLHFPKWHLHQKVSKPSPSRLPVCPLHGLPVETPGNQEPPGGARGANGRPRGTLASRVPEEQGTGNREGRKNSSSPATPATASDDDPQFAAFWRVYPRKVGKGQARRAWRAMLGRGASPPAVTAAAEHFARDRHRDPQFTPHPATWLNGERYNDAAPDDPAGDDAPWNA